MKKIWHTLKKLNRTRNIKTKKLKIYIKLSLFNLLFKFNLRKQLNSKFTPDEYENVLIFMHTHGIGDVIVISGFINELKNKNKKVYVIAERRILFLFKSIIVVDGIIEYNDKKILQLKNTLKNYYFDLVVDFSDYDHSFFKRIKTLFYLNYKHAIAFNQGKNKFFSTNIIYTENKHISGRMIYVLNLLNIEVDCYKYKVNIQDKTKEKINKFLNKIKENKKIIIFNPFASCKIRSMSIEQIYFILNFLEYSRNFVTIVFDVDHQIKYKNYSNIIIPDLITFEEAAELVKRSDFIFTVDTSIVHVAQAFNKKQLAIYNNRMANNFFKNNILWGANYDLATQIYTKEYLNTECGDLVSNLDVEYIIDFLKEKLLLIS